MRLVYNFCPGRQPSAPVLFEKVSSIPSTWLPITAAFFLLLIPQLTEGQCYTMICNQNVELALGNDCTGSVNPHFIIENNWSCQGPMIMEYFDTSGNSIGNVATGDYLGQTLQVQVTHKWTGLTCWGSVYIVDKKKPIIEATHFNLHCTQDAGVEALGEPLVSDNCSSTIALSHQDSLVEFGCDFSGFTGYFEPSNWTVCTTNNGDGGVDVTGAPNSILVEGTSNSPQTSSPCYVTSFSIVIPTEGYVSFDWSSFGGSSFNFEAFYLTINNHSVQLTNDSIQSGSFTTELLYPGDVLSFDQTSDGDSNVINTLISNFYFQTSAWQVIRRQWTAVDEWNNSAAQTQFITIKRTQLSQVVFPPDLDGVQAPLLPCDAGIDPQDTGLPFVDLDGDLSTLNDQFPVGNSNCFFTMEYQDQEEPACEGSELTLRKWIVTDECTGISLEHEQHIYRSDLTPPVLTCPPPTVLSTNNFGCFGIINLPQATASDNCSSQLTITPSWLFGTGYGPFDDIETGTYTVTYAAADACGNTATCTTTVTIEDDVPPTAICDGFASVSLDSEGQAVVYANAVDDGSYDWCCIASYEIRRYGDPESAYASSLSVSCSDLGTPVLIILRVTDCNGNTNSCDLELSVHDELAPVILAPADLTADCSADLSDLAQFGQAVATDNCSYNLVETVSYDVTNCGEGTLTRIFTATDSRGNSSTAQQIIHLTHLNPWNLDGSQILWPEDISLPGCGISMEPEDLFPPYNEPIITSGQAICQSVTVSHQDQILWVAEPACYFIYRTWTVTDWCQYQPAAGNLGIWQHLQVLGIQDFEPPVFINPPSNITVPLVNGCTGDITIPVPEVEDCSSQVEVVATGSLGSGFSFQNVQAGIYQMTFIASDGCGNVATHDFTLTLADDSPPVASCLNGLTVSLSANGKAVVPATVFGMSSYDNCTPGTDLQFSYSPVPGDETRLFTCNDVGQHDIQIWVFDQSGNSSSCQTFLMIPENPEACNPVPSGIKIGGVALTPSGLPIGQAAVHLTGAPVPPAVTQAGIGGFSFQDLPPGNTYTLTPSKNSGMLNGVTAFDLAKINDHILANNLFSEYWQYIAADANSSGTVTTADIIAIQGLILGNENEFPNGTPSWRFIPSDHAFPNPDNPFPYPQSKMLNNLASDYPAANFTGIKTGDVTGNADPSFLQGSCEEQATSNGLLLERTGSPYTLKTSNPALRTGEEIEVILKSEEAVIAWQFTLELDPQVLVFKSLENALSTEPLAKGRHRIAEGKLTALWYGEQPQAVELILKLGVLQDARLQEVLHLNSSIAPAFAWNERGEHSPVRLQFAGPTVESVSLVNFPNPFSENTTISFELPEAGRTKFSFFDASGRLIQTMENQFKKGHNELIIKREDIAAKGLVFYQMESEWGVATGKMLVQ